MRKAEVTIDNKGDHIKVIVEFDDYGINEAGALSFLTRPGTVTGRRVFAPGRWLEFRVIQ